MRLHPAETSVRSFLAIFRLILAITHKRLLHRKLYRLAVFIADAFQERLDVPAERSGLLPMDSFHVFRPADASAFDVPIPCANIRGLQAEAHPLLALPSCSFKLLDS